MPRAIAFILLLICAADLHAQATHNDDSCDIGVAPAATLLLPYFEVGLEGNSRHTTIFSVTNVSPYSQIARVTLWTDWAFPVLTFNIYLTGYDVQPINLYDVIVRGVVGDHNGTSTDAPNARANAGRTPNLMGRGMPSGTNRTAGVQPFLASSHQGNPNFLPSASTDCAPGRLPGVLPAGIQTDIRAVLSTGRSTGAGIECLGPGGEQQVGTNHGGIAAIGYATIDVVGTCSTTLPTQTDYFTRDILFDNVLIGDYADVYQSGGRINYAVGNPMVHIRAIPEGGPASAPAVATNLPFTFYDRLLAPAAGIERTFDRRQPLPSVFAARWISGSISAFETQYKIWREGFTTGEAGGFASCTDYVVNYQIPFVEIVRFDERENAGVGSFCFFETCYSPTTPSTSRETVTSVPFPVVPGSTDVGGWTYFNLNAGGDGYASSAFGVAPYNATRPGFGTGAGALGAFPRDVTQSWVTVSMLQMVDGGGQSSPQRDGVEYDAAWLGNGCSPVQALTSFARSKNGNDPIGPAANVNP